MSGENGDNGVDNREIARAWSDLRLKRHDVGQQRYAFLTDLVSFDRGVPVPNCSFDQRYGHLNGRDAQMQAYRSDLANALEGKPLETGQKRLFA